MRPSTLMVINAIVALFFGLGLVLAPGALVSLYGAQLGEAGIYVARLLGAEFLSYAVLTWFARDSEESAARRAILFALVTSFGVGFIVALGGQLSGVTNALGWFTVVVYLLFALGYGYFQFLKPGAS
jgi:hypothetical protein